MEIWNNPLIIRGMKDLHMEIGENGYALTDPEHWTKKEVKAPFSRLYLIHKGEGWLRVNGRKITMHAGTAYFIPAGLLFDFGCDAPMEKLYFHVHLVKPDGYDLANGLPSIAECPLDAAWLKKMISLYRSDDFVDSLALKSGIYDILIRLLRQYPLLRQPIPRYSALTEQTMRYVQDHLSARLSSGGIAEALFVSESVLNRTFRREVGKTLRQYAEDMVFTKAQKQLLETSRSLGQISEELEFCDMFYFSRRFRQRYGEAPSAYRKRLKTEGQALLPFKRVY